jgi:ribosome recycling factor
MSHIVKDLILVENDTKSFQTAMEAELSKTIKHYEVELLKIRTGRAHTNLVEDIDVSCYGQDPVALKGLALIAAPDASLITVQPWDPGIIPDIEKAITASDTGLRPVNDGKMIRLQLQKMSSSRRDELLKILGKKTEESKISVRNIRKDFNNTIRDAKKDKTISENFFNRLEDLLESITEKFIKRIEELSQKKEKEITTV